jgi:hypothetical protein
MRWIKLFEKFGKLDPNELLEDIKSIDYELDNYDIEYKFIIPGSPDMFLTPDEYNNLHQQEQYNNRLNVKCKGIFIKIGLNYKFSEDKCFDDINRFISLLKEHLDYVDPKKIGHNNDVWNKKTTTKKIFIEI